MSFLADTFTNIQTIIDTVPNAIFMKNRAHQIVMLNDSACDFFGHSREILLNRSDFDLFPADQVRIFHDADDRAFASGLASENEEQITNAAGLIRHVLTRKRVARLEGAEYLVVSVTDVSASRAAEAQNRYLAFHDVLTGLPNRALLKERIEHTLMRRRHGCALLHIDVDSFEHLSDQHGHQFGDDLVQEFTQRLAGIVRAADTVARIGDHQFAVLLSDTSKDPKAEEVCRRVLMAAGRPFDIDGNQVKVSASIGIVLTGMENIEPAELQRRADVALYQAKNEGRGCFRVFTQALDERVSSRHSLQAELGEALATGAGLELYYQPIVGISSGAVEGFEALVRWRHPARGLVMPGDFIPIAETSGLIIELGEWVLAKACEEAACWNPPLRLSVNVSPIQFASGELVTMVKRVLDKTAFDPARLDLEITEGVLIQDPETALTMLNRIRALSVKTVLDDFGVDYSSLSYFRQFPFDKVKIDRTFIADMLENRGARSIVEAVISLARGLDLEVVAEGVESFEQLAALTKLGCTHAQGYLLGRPMPIEHFQNVVRPARQIQAG